MQAKSPSASAQGAQEQANSVQNQSRDARKVAQVCETEVAMTAASPPRPLSSVTPDHHSMSISKMNMSQASLSSRDHPSAAEMDETQLVTYSTNCAAKESKAARRAQFLDEYGNAAVMSFVAARRSMMSCSMTDMSRRRCSSPSEHNKNKKKNKNKSAEREQQQLFLDSCSSSQRINTARMIFADAPQCDEEEKEEVEPIITSPTSTVSVLCPRELLKQKLDQSMRKSCRRCETELDHPITASAAASAAAGDDAPDDVSIDTALDMANDQASPRSNRRKSRIAIKAAAAGRELRRKQEQELPRGPSREHRRRSDSSKRLSSRSDSSTRLALGARPGRNGRRRGTNRTVGSVQIQRALTTKEQVVEVSNGTSGTLTAQDKDDNRYENYDSEEKETEENGKQEIHDQSVAENSLRRNPSKRTSFFSTIQLPSLVSMGNNNSKHNRDDGRLENADCAESPETGTMGSFFGKFANRSSKNCPVR